METISYILAGNATFTVKSLKTGAHLTFKVRKGEEDTAPHFVSVLTGSDNENSFTYLGTIFKGQNFFHGRRSPIGKDAPSAKGFDWFWKNIQGLQGKAEFLPSGKCCRCNRTLTTPESIELGIGPECASKMGM